MALTETPVANPADAGPVRHSRMALAAVGLSIFSFILPFGIAAVVLGHIARRRIAASHGSLDGRTTALAALIIGYCQIVLVSSFALLLWQVLHLTVRDFRRDPLVQRVFRETDPNQTLDHASAVEEEATARSLVIQLVAIEEQQRWGEEPRYLCSVGELMETGVVGATPAEKQAFDERLWRSAYSYEVRACNSRKNESRAAAYKLSAVPRPPRMPDGFRIFCADQTGTVKQIFGGTSGDCFDHGEVILRPASPERENLPVEPEQPAPPPQKPVEICTPSEKTPCGADMKLVRAEWRSPEALWEFLTSPEKGARGRAIAAGPGSGQCARHIDRVFGD